MDIFHQPLRSRFFDSVVEKLHLTASSPTSEGYLCARRADAGYQINKKEFLRSSIQ